MRVKITFLLQRNSNLPVNYNYYLASLIYKILYHSSHKFSAFLHDQGFEFEGKHFKLFTFSQLLFEKKRIEKDKIINLGKHITWFISSIKDEFIQHFIDGLFKKSRVTLEKQTLIPERVETVAQPELNGINRFTCLSPITMSTKIDKDGKPHLYYLRIDEPDFKEKVKENLIRKYNLIYGRPPQNKDFEMEFDKEYLNANKTISRLINFKGINIRGYTVPFIVKGNPELVKVGYECGLGDKNSLGFGMVKLLNEEKEI